ncbi:MAG: 2-oxo acid dehydrogenase subunit E2 [Phycisphaeraceae bacterium]|nr:2-oxo acid dehydrogenase subunit E2 [Phycisphaeraceae bacterium]QYK48841.1 MAG: 2-oxo acid dehydrogenase subunit E2 [Phycisphaeraceae bacterium]
MAHQKSADPNVFILPDLGEGVHEAELIKWRVQVGQTVAEHDILAEMETDKALVEVPSPRAGTIKELHGVEGEIQHVGNPLVTYVGDAASESKPAASAKPASSGHANGAHAEPAEPAHREDAGTVVGKMSGELAGMSAAPGKALATPAVRRLARDLNIDIDRVSGSGIGGRVTEKDVRAAASGGASGGPRCDMAQPSIPAAATTTTSRTPAPAPRTPAPAAPARAATPAPAPRPAVTFAPGEAVTRIPFRGVRRTIANRLRESVNQAVHFNVMDEADVSALDTLRKKLAAASGEKVSFLPFVCSAVCRTLSMDQFRVLNSTTDDANEEIIQHRAIHMGIATDTDNGLMVPVVRDCDALGVLEIGRHVNQIASSARDRSIPRDQLMGSTFTISNVGSYAGRFATPIINYPEVGILAVGRTREGVVVRNGGMFVGKLMPLSLACDHRVVDGATAALALAEIVRLLQDPEALLAPARG